MKFPASARVRIFPTEIMSFLRFQEERKKKKSHFFFFLMKYFKMFSLEISYYIHAACLLPFGSADIVACRKIKAGLAEGIKNPDVARADRRRHAPRS